MTKPLLLSPRQQRFVQAIVNGASQSAAYRVAGYSFSSKRVAEVNASRLLHSDKVQAVLLHSRAAAQERAEVTTDVIIDRLEEARQIALTADPPQAAAAVAAALGQAKVLGLVIDRSELNVTHNKPSLLPTTQLELSVDEWRRQFDPVPELKEATVRP